jgi:periplasmic protein TonB
MMKRKWSLLVVAVIVAGCKKSGDGGTSSFQTVGRPPDLAPVMLNKDLPFRYPPVLFAQKVQGNVTLRIFIDRTGQVIPESTHVAETSGYSALDSAAVKGSRDLRFTPAKTQDQPVPVSILLPIFFRYPGAPPLPGDTVLKRAPFASSTPPLVDSSAAPADTPATKKATARKSTRKRRR